MVPFFDYRPAYLQHKGEIDAAIREVLDSGQLVLGPQVCAFEQEFARFVGAGGAVGVGSGTDALILALQALEVGRGDEVITVANAGAPPVAAIRAVGATPRFVDVAADTLLMDPEGLDRVRSSRTRCLLPVHLYGQAAPIEALVDYARRHSLHVVEDCAQAHGARYRGQHVGVFGDIGCFSFYPTKNLGAFGDGGICVTRDPALEERLRMLRMYGFRNDQHAHCEARNTRLDELQAAILRVKLRHLQEALSARRQLARCYREALRGSCYRLPGIDEAASHAYHLFVIRTAERRELEERLRRAGIGFGIHYPIPVHLMEGYRFLGLGKGDLPATEESCTTVLSLPLFPGLGASAVDEVVETLLAES